PVIITEGGASFDDRLEMVGLEMAAPDAAGLGAAAPALLSSADGKKVVVADTRRIDYLYSHLRSALTATARGGPAEGVDLRGYYVWTLMDNFEWSAGYKQPFGLVHV